jgi:hypothetical protein
LKIIKIKRKIPRVGKNFSLKKVAASDFKGKFKTFCEKNKSKKIAKEIFIALVPSDPASEISKYTNTEQTIIKHRIYLLNKISISEYRDIINGTLSFGESDKNKIIDAFYVDFKGIVGRYSTIISEDTTSTYKKDDAESDIKSLLEDFQDYASGGGTSRQVTDNMVYENVSFYENFKTRMANEFITLTDNDASFRSEKDKIGADRVNAIISNSFSNFGTLSSICNVLFGAGTNYKKLPLIFTTHENGVSLDSGTMSDIKELSEDVFYSKTSLDLKAEEASSASGTEDVFDYSDHLADQKDLRDEEYVINQLKIICRGKTQRVLFYMAASFFLDSFGIALGKNTQGRSFTKPTETVPELQVTENNIERRFNAAYALRKDTIDNNIWLMYERGALARSRNIPIPYSGGAAPASLSDLSGYPIDLSSISYVPSITPPPADDEKRQKVKELIDIIKSTIKKYFLEKHLGDIKNPSVRLPRGIATRYPDRPYKNEDSNNHLSEDLTETIKLYLAPFL